MHADMLSPLISAPVRARRVTKGGE